MYGGMAMISELTIISGSVLPVDRASHRWFVDHHLLGFSMLPCLDTLCKIMSHLTSQKIAPNLDTHRTERGGGIISTHSPTIALNVGSMACLLLACLMLCFGWWQFYSKRLFWLDYVNTNAKSGAAFHQATVPSTSSSFLLPSQDTTRGYFFTWKEFIIIPKVR